MAGQDVRGTERLEALKKLLADDPRSLAFVTLAEEHIRVGQHAEAVSVAQRGLLTHPDSVAGRLALAMAEAEQDHLAEAVEQIKRALLIDQENPRALALMGRILLKRGLARRAVQFASHAVKLDAQNKEYSELLATARKAAKNEPSTGDKLPVFGIDQVPENESPWQDGEPQPGSEHTVFDPDALKKLKSKDLRKRPVDRPERPQTAEGLNAALQQLPGMGDGLDDESEPTAFVDRIDPSKIKPRATSFVPREEPTAFAGNLPPRPPSKNEAPAPREEPTAYAAPGTIPRKKAKMGGSAAEFSQMMRSVEPPPPPPVATEDLATGAPPPVSRSKPPPPPPADPPAQRVSEPPKIEAEAPKSVADTPKIEAKPEPEKPRAEPVAEAPVEKPAEPKTPEKPPEKPTEAPEPPRAKDPKKAIGPMATRMVDEALWQLFGQKNPVEVAPAVAPAPADADSKKEAPKAKGEEAPKAPAPGMVVRTSERFGLWTRWAVLLVLGVAALATGYGLAVSTAGSGGAEVTSEELKGLATEMERGGLAALMAAEEQALVLKTSSPRLEPLVDAVLAEIYAVRWASFGQDPELYGKAQGQLSALQNPNPTLEQLAAEVALSTGTVSRRAVLTRVQAAQRAYPLSPKALLLQGDLLAAEGKGDDALDIYYRAHALNPEHRGTLLALARWHARQGSHATAFVLYDQLLDKQSRDVEAAIERYVLGQATGEDPAESQAVATLAGLVRHELAEVAKDEAGRAALAFAVAMLAKNQLVEGFDELTKAEAAFNQSAQFKATLGSLFVALGDHERAKKQYTRALELQDRADHRLGLARATVLERLGKKTDLAEAAKAQQKAPLVAGQAQLPYGVARFVIGRFELVEVEPDADLFPEAAYAELLSQYSGAELLRAADAVSLLAAARRKLEDKQFDAARRLLDEAMQLRPDAATQLLLGRLHLQQKDFAGATRSLRQALAQDAQNPAIRLGLARALIAEGRPLEAIEVLEPLERGAEEAPDGLLLLAELRLSRGDPTGALPTLESVAQIRPGSARAWLNLGRAQHLLDRRDEAKTSFAKALAVQPKLAESPPESLLPLSAVAEMYLGLLVSDRNQKRGLALLRTAQARDDAPLDARFYLGKALYADRKTKRDGRRQLELFVREAQDGELKDEAQRLLKQR